MKCQMAASNKKADPVSVQVEVTTDQEWQEIMSLKGLLVDVYQEWCGPCVAMQSLLKKLKMDIDDDDMLHFAAVKPQNFEFMKEYLDNCEPTWLFYGSGNFLGCMKGTNAPLMLSVIKTMMDNERKLMEGETATRQTLEDLTNSFFNKGGQPISSDNNGTQSEITCNYCA